MLKNVSRHAARFGALFFLCALLSACGREPPGCADEETVALVKETFWNTAARNAVDQDDKALLAAVRPKFDVTVELPRVVEKQADAGKLLCTADLKVKLGAEAEKTVDKMFRRESGASIEYSSQITADGKGHLVEVAGDGAPVEFVWSLAKMGAFSRPPEADRATQPAAPALAKPSAPPAQDASPAAAVPAAPTSSGQQASPPPADPGSPEAAYQAADKALNEAYQAARAALPEARRVALRDEQRGWIKRRDGACSDDAIRAETKGMVDGGTAMESERLACETKMAQDRTHQLLGK